MKKRNSARALSVLLSFAMLFTSIMPMNLNFATEGAEAITQLNPVTADIASGTKVASGSKVNLNMTSDAAIYFTTDNTTPTSQSAVTFTGTFGPGSYKYTGPLTISNTVNIKAIASKVGYQDSAVANFNYIVEAVVPPVPPVATTLPIAEARKAAKGSTVMVEGVVTGIYSNGAVLYIQDGTGGITIKQPKKNIDISIGSRVKAVGKTDAYKELIQVVAGAATDVIVLKTPLEYPAPKVFKLGTDKLADFESQVIQINNLVITKTTFDEKSPTKYYYVTFADQQDATKSIEVKVEGFVKPGSLVVGNKYLSVTTPLGRENTRYLMMITGEKDLVQDLPPDVVAPVITHTAIAKSSIFNDFEVKATITDDRLVKGVKLYYKSKDAADYKSVPMNSIATEYFVTIPKSELTLSGLQYYIEATDGVNVVTLPSDKASPCQVVIDTTDIVAPVINSVLPSGSAILLESEVKPEIKVTFTDDSGLDTTSTKMTVDGKDVSTSLVYTDKTVAYKPTTALSQGNHTVNVTLQDKAGNKVSKEWVFAVGEMSYNFYYGQLHGHTNLSDGKGTIDEAFTWARDQGKADFFAVTDHSNSLYVDDKDLDWTKSAKWKIIKDKANQYNQDGKYVALSGFEMTWSGSTGGWGHMNTFNTEWLESRLSGMNLNAYYNKIMQDPKSISQMNHPGKSYGDFADFGFYSKEADAVINLLEVGNGEGPIHGKGYFPSYEAYTRALDKGWHVAPTINQDNHQANWVSANDGRTVILAPNLTRESIFDAIQKMHVYATEDKNLKVTYKVNGQLMGATLVKPEKLDISIQVTDPDKNDDSIKSISIIVDGGAVVATKNFNSNEVSWNIELPSEYSYYYVKIEQADKDISVTAPVWTGEVVPVGISKVEAAQDPVVLDSTVDIKTVLYNNGLTPSAESKVEYYVNEISEANKIGEMKVGAMAAGGFGESLLAWKADRKGDLEIIVKMTTEYKGKPRISVTRMPLLVGLETELTKVVLDTYHNNYYVSGEYAGKMSNLKQMAKERRYMVVENKAPFTAETLKNTKILILTDPQSVKVDKKGDQPEINKMQYTAEEVAAIKAYVDNGGNLIITSRADYKDAAGEYGNAAEGNRILEAIGSNLRFNDDQMIDKEKNGGDAYRLYFNQYTGDKYFLTNSFEETDTFSFYSGNSVILKKDGNDSNVEWVVKGHSTTINDDADKQGDFIPTEPGKAYGLGVELLPGGGRIAVGGSTFFSDFETSSGDNAYSNLQLTKNIFKWMILGDVKITKIADLKKDSDNNGIPDLMGQKFTVDGTVTSQSVAVKPKNGFFDVVYVQDETGGTTVFGAAQLKLQVGAKVRISGKVSQYEQDAQLALSNEFDDITVISKIITPIAPTKMTTANSMLEKNEGLLVEVKGVVTKIETVGSDNALYLNDGSGEAKVFLNGYIGDGSGNPDTLGKWNPAIKVGDTVSAVGLASEDMRGHRLRVRNTSEIVLITSPVRDKEDKPSKNTGSGTVTPSTQPQPSNPVTPATDNKAADAAKEKAKATGKLTDAEKAIFKEAIKTELKAQATSNKLEDRKQLKENIALLNKVLGNVEAKQELLANPEALSKAIATSVENLKKELVATGLSEKTAKPVVTLESTTEKISLSLQSADLKVAKANGADFKVATADASVKVANADLNADKAYKVAIEKDTSLKGTAPKQMAAISEGVKLETEFKAVQLAIPVDAAKAKTLGVFKLDEAKKTYVLVKSQMDAATGSLVVNDASNGQYVVAEVKTAFADTSKTWAKDTIAQVSARGIMVGLAEDKFAPEKTVTKAEFAAALLNVIGKADPNAKDWKTSSVAAANQLGFGANFLSDKTADKAITREEMAYMMAKAYALKAEFELQASTLNFKDAKNVNKALQGEVAKAQELGLVKGMADGNFKPASTGTRAEAAQMLLNLASNL